MNITTTSFRWRTPACILFPVAALIGFLAPFIHAQQGLPDRIAAPLKSWTSAEERVDAMNNAAWHLRHNDPVQALEWALRARDLADSASYERGLGWAYRNEAVVEYVLGEYADALTSNLEALRIFERLGERDGIASAHLNIGLVHWQIGNPEKAQQYFHDALAKNPSPTLTATAYGNIGLMHTEQAEYRNALANTEKALDIYRRIGDALGESTMLNNLGWIYELQQKPTDALKYYERSLAIRRKIGDKRRIASVSISIGSILRQQKHFDEALEFLARALQLSREIGDKKQIEASYEEMSRAYADMGNFEQAYLHFVRFAGARDSIVDDRIAVDIAKLEANFRMEQAEREVALLTRANELQSTIVYITSAGLVLVLIFSVVSFIGYRSKSRINRRLEATQKQLIVQEKLASLGQLTAGIAHEIQNPLNFITNFSEVSRELLLELDETDDPEERTAILGDLGQSVRKIHEHGVRADGIVRSMMLHARSSSEEPQLTDVDALISYVIELATHATTASNMPRPPVFDARLEPLLPAVRVVPQDLSQVFLNIINNAVDALSERSHLVTEGYEPRITITTGVQGRSLIIRIRDNGIGIPESIRGRIFEPFYTTKDSGKGTGLGLSISYDLIVQKYGGTIDVASQENEYTEFIMTLPTV